MELQSNTWFLGITPGSRNAGAWDSIHVFEATDRARTCHYRLTSTVILHLSTGSETLGEMDLSGNMTRQIEVDMAVDGDASHISNVGHLVEDMEIKMRNLLRMHPFSHQLLYFCLSMAGTVLTRFRIIEEVYFGKAKDVVSELRSEFEFIITHLSIGGV